MIQYSLILIYSLFQAQPDEIKVTTWVKSKTKQNKKQIGGSQPNLKQKCLNIKKRKNIPIKSESFLKWARSCNNFFKSKKNIPLKSQAVKKVRKSYQKRKPQLKKDGGKNENTNVSADIPDFAEINSFLNESAAKARPAAPIKYGAFSEPVTTYPLGPLVSLVQPRLDKDNAENDKQEPPKLASLFDKNEQTIFDDLDASGQDLVAQVATQDLEEKMSKSGTSNRCTPGPLGAWSKSTHSRRPQQQQATPVPIPMPEKDENTTTDLDGFKLLVRNFKYKKENEKLQLQNNEFKLQVAKYKKKWKDRIIKEKVEQANNDLKAEKERKALVKVIETVEAERDYSRTLNNQKRAKISRLKKTVKRLESKPHTDLLVNKGTKKILETANFTPAMSRSIMNPGKGVHYGKEDIVRALVSRCLGEKAFRHMRKTASYKIPSRQTQERWLGDLMSSMPGFQTDAITAIKVEGEKSKDERFHEAIITFDEMSLAQKMEMHMKTQQIFGPHKKVMTVMMRGLTTH